MQEQRLINKLQIIADHHEQDPHIHRALCEAIEYIKTKQQQPARLSNSHRLSEAVAELERRHEVYRRMNDAFDAGNLSELRDVRDEILQMGEPTYMVTTFEPAKQEVVQISEDPKCEMCGESSDVLVNDLCTDCETALYGQPSY